MTLMFNKETPDSYKDVLGAEKFLHLWQEYLTDAESKFQKINALVQNKNWPDLRIIFHSLKSSSLIFGLDKFSKLCTKIEDCIVGGVFNDELLSDINNSKNLWLESIEEVKAYFQP